METTLYDRSTLQKGKLMDFRGVRVLITGNTGFCGLWLSALLEQLGAEVTGFSRDQSDFSTMFKPRDISLKWPTEAGCIEDAERFHAVISEKKPDLIFHLAAQSLVQRGYAFPRETFQANAIGTLNVMESALTLPHLKGVVVVTTDKVYASSDQPNFEDSPLGGIDPYSCSKVSAEQIVKSFRYLFNQQKVPLTVVRGGNVIGGGDWSENRLVPDIVRASLSGQALLLRYPGALRPWQHVLDLVYAYAVIGNRMLDGFSDVTNTEYNVGPNQEESVSVRDVVDLFAKCGFVVPVKIVPPANYESAQLLINSEKIREALGWRAEYTGFTAVEQTAIWYREALRSDADTLALQFDEVRRFLERKNHGERET